MKTALAIIVAVLLAVIGSLIFSGCASPNYDVVDLYIQNTQAAQPGLGSAQVVVGVPTNAVMWGLCGGAEVGEIVHVRIKVLNDGTPSGHLRNVPTVGAVLPVPQVKASGHPDYEYMSAFGICCFWPFWFSE